MTFVVKAGEGLDLHIEREFTVPREIIWRCWTEAELLGEWYCPKPWRADVHKLDVRPGGTSEMTFKGPEGEAMPQNGMYLYVDPHRELVFTDSYREGFIPQADSFMTGYVQLEDTPDGGTKMIWGAKHATEDGRKQHLEMGFEQGWGAAAGQLDELARELAS
ncbi:MAG: polyketide cyclase [Ponticaulis sp.]|nr:polyketide cyclase [Ponticaulis sp.]